ncbi:MAG: DUF1476 domain-containing protein [Rhodospirillales bacterium]|nr:DUF1476 domain-containing protein [Rhodospirillales bacterium]
MTDIFREIEQGYEAKYKLDEETRFKVHSRRNKLFGLWAAGLMGLDDGKAVEYARGLARLDLDPSAVADIADKVHADLAAAGTGIETRDIVAALARADEEAHRQIAAAYPMPLDSDHVQVGG